MKTSIRAANRRMGIPARRGRPDASEDDGQECPSYGARSQTHFEAEAK